MYICVKISGIELDGERIYPEVSSLSLDACLSVQEPKTEDLKYIYNSSGRAGSFKLFRCFLTHEGKNLNECSGPPE